MLRKTTETPTRIVGNLAGIRIGYLSSTGLERYRYTNLLSSFKVFVHVSSTLVSYHSQR
jgi:hypothetical protein